MDTHLVLSHRIKTSDHGHPSSLTAMSHFVPKTGVRDRRNLHAAPAQKTTPKDLDPSLASWNMCFLISDLWLLPQCTRIGVCLNQQANEGHLFAHHWSRLHGHLLSLVWQVSLFPKSEPDLTVDLNNCVIDASSRCGLSLAARVTVQLAGHSGACH